MITLLSRLLSRSFFYKLSQSVLAPGAETGLKRAISSVIDQMPKVHNILDVGCGPESWLAKCTFSPVGIDISPRYIQTFNKKSHGYGVVASAMALPFPNGVFDATWSVGLFHHLPNSMVTQSINEMLRVTQDGGYVAIIDGVLPNLQLRRVFAYAIRRLERGRYFRSQDTFCLLLAREVSWKVERITYSKTGLEAVVCVAKIAPLS